MEKKSMKLVKVWDIFVRIFHWTLVSSVLGLYLSGETFENEHIKLGYFVIGLVLYRVLWGFIGPGHARFSDFLYPPGTIYNYLKSLITGNPKHYLGHNPAGGFMIIVMLVVLSLTLFTGLKALGSKGRGPLADTDIPFVRTVYADGNEHSEYDEYKGSLTGRHAENEKEDLWEEVHEFMTNFMIALIVVHISGVIISSWLHKENLVLSMLTGKKKIP